MLEYERQAWQSGFERVAGLDEAGRGPLAGPVVAAALTFERRFLEAEEHGALRQLTDSKQLTESRRESFYELLLDSPSVEIGIGSADAVEIDSLNILRATHLAMGRAVRGLAVLPDHILVDGLFVPGLPCSSTPIIEGDAKSLSIAAASVIAKVTRDALMRELDRRYPVYGFAAHKGYGTKFHTQALLEHGPSPVHRRSFRPVQEIVRIRDWIARNAASGDDTTTPERP